MRKTAILEQLMTMVPARVRGDVGLGSNKGLICVYLIKRSDMHEFFAFASSIACKGGKDAGQKVYDFIMANAVDDPEDEVILVKFNAFRTPDNPNEIRSYSAPLHSRALAYVAAEDGVANVRSHVGSAAAKYGLTNREDMLAEALHLPIVHLEFPEFVDYDPALHGAFIK